MLDDNSFICLILPELQSIDIMTFIMEFQGYYFDKKKLYSKHGNEIKLTVKGYTKGYWLNNKFITINKLKSLTFVKDIEVPF